MNGTVRIDSHRVQQDQLRDGRRQHAEKARHTAAEHALEKRARQAGADGDRARAQRETQRQAAETQSVMRDYERQLRSRNNGNQVN
jgi:hypothetical protein